ncbi:MAG: hypothetical protein K6T86_07675 [Pirellulales bacterium]|nr:hypothetical protein [Pirellulales bacterium]
MRFGNLSRLSLLLLAVLGVSAPATADTFFTQLGTLNPPAAPASNVILVTGTGGATYSNVVGTPGVGASVFAVGAVPISSANLAFGPPFTSLQAGFWTASGGNTGIAVFAVQGSITAISGNNATVAFTAGQIDVYAVNGGNFNFKDPGTWGTSGTSLGQWTLATPANIVQGNANADSGTFASTQVNVISGAIAAGNLLSGPTLWDKAASNTLLVASTFDPFGLASVVKEQLEVRIKETIEANYGSSGSIPLANLVALLNSILSNAGLGNSGFSDFDPNNLATSFDFFATLQTEAAPGVQFFIIPEPASVLLWGSLGMGALVVGRHRRRSKSGLLSA